MKKIIKKKRVGGERERERGIVVLFLSVHSLTSTDNVITDTVAVTAAAVAAAEVNKGPVDFPA